MDDPSNAFGRHSTDALAHFPDGINGYLIKHHLIRNGVLRTPKYKKTSGKTILLLIFATETPPIINMTDNGLHFTL
ncbi:MAG: hypothetical protein IJK42_03575 [Prevotella sp.]|nr:hypothetical protein [Prevotella sp.]